MGKKPSKQKHAKRGDGSAPPSYTKIGLQFTQVAGSAGVVAALAEMKKLVDTEVTSKATMHRAADHLAEEFDDLRLRTFVEKEWPTAPRGRSPHKLGDEGDYSMQETDGRTFLRIPGGHLNIPKSGKARVRFEPGPRIVIEPAPKKAKRSAARFANELA